MSEYIQLPITRIELQDLVTVTQQEIEDFFIRNPHLVQFYESRLIGACLCQGAALHYIGLGKGVKDFDIHIFYRKNSIKPRLSRAVKEIYSPIGSFPREMKIDFVRTLIPHDENEVDEETLILNFLNERPTSNAWNLSQKAVVGLIPDNIFTKVLWPIDR